MQLVGDASRADSIGFDAVMISDHLQPWTPAQGHAAHVWTTIGAIARRPIASRSVWAWPRWFSRNHPIDVAHAAATAAVLLGGRFVLGVGAGERLNEQPYAQRWPRIGERRERLAEAIDVIRALWSGEPVNHDGTHWRVENLTLYERPPVPPRILVAAAGKRSPRLAGESADGMIGVSPDAHLVAVYRGTVDRLVRRPGPRVARRDDGRRARQRVDMVAQRRRRPGRPQRARSARALRRSRCIGRDASRSAMSWCARRTPVRSSRPSIGSSGPASTRSCCTRSGRISSDSPTSERASCSATIADPIDLGCRSQPIQRRSASTNAAGCSRWTTCPASSDDLDGRAGDRGRHVGRDRCGTWCRARRRRAARASSGRRGGPTADSGHRSRRAGGSMPVRRTCWPADRRLRPRPVAAERTGGVRASAPGTSRHRRVRSRRPVVRQRLDVRHAPRRSPRPGLALDEHEPFDEFRSGDGEVEREAAAHRVPDIGRRADVPRDRVGGRGEIEPSVTRRAVPGGVDRDDLEAITQCRGDRVPRPAGLREPVQEDEAVDVGSSGRRAALDRQIGTHGSTGVMRTPTRRAGWPRGDGTPARTRRRPGRPGSTTDRRSRTWGPP